jgi:thioredoxin 1
MSQYCEDINDQNFETQVTKSSLPVLVDFWAPWCGPCLSVAPTLETLAQEYKGRLRIAKMNVDENPHVPVQFGVRSIPYMVLIKNGVVCDSVVGAVPKAQIVAILDKHLD